MALSFRSRECRMIEGGNRLYPEEAGRKPDDMLAVMLEAAYWHNDSCNGRGRPHVSLA